MKPVNGFQLELPRSVVGPQLVVLLLLERFLHRKPLRLHEAFQRLNLNGKYKFIVCFCFLHKSGENKEKVCRSLLFARFLLSHESLDLIFFAYSVLIEICDTLSEKKQRETYT